MTAHLSLEDLLQLVADLQVGPVRDVGLLESAAQRPRTSLWGREAYATVELKAAALLESLVSSHALWDGHKRLGWLAVVVFLAINDVELEADDDAAYGLIIAVPQGQTKISEVADQLARWSITS